MFRFPLATAIALICAPSLIAAETPAETKPVFSWEDVPAVKFEGDLGFYWNILGGDAGNNQREALARGFKPVVLLNTYADYHGKPRQNVHPFSKSNPWKKPSHFKEVVQRNIEKAEPNGLYVQDIEFEFHDDSAKAWDDPEARAASGARTLQEFDKRYLKEWATWFSVPCDWSKKKYPNVKVGLYGPQPFKRDFWGVAGKDAKQIDGGHKTDGEMWKFIHPSVDFVISSTYCFYDEPGSVYYMAANIEENVARTEEFGKKPVYAYQWLKFHEANAKLRGQELTNYLVEANAVIPYFFGARGAVLWGWEPGSKGQPYRTLPLYMRSLARLAPFSKAMSTAKLVRNEPAHASWKAKTPLIREFKFSAGESLVMVCNPWQEETSEQVIAVKAAGASHKLTVRGRHTEIYHIKNGAAARIEMAPAKDG